MVTPHVYPTPDEVKERCQMVYEMASGESPARARCEYTRLLFEILQGLSDALNAPVHNVSLIRDSLQHTMAFVRGAAAMLHLEKECPDI